MKHVSWKWGDSYVLRGIYGFFSFQPFIFGGFFVVLLPPRLEPPLHHLTCGVPNFGDAKCEGKRVVNTFVGRSRLQNVQKYPYHYGFMWIFWFKGGKSKWDFWKSLREKNGVRQAGSIYENGPERSKICLASVTCISCWHLFKLPKTPW